MTYGHEIERDRQTDTQRERQTHRQRERMRERISRYGVTYLEFQYL